MKESGDKHWGRWVKERALVVGFRGNKSFVSAVGCQRKILSMWLDRDTPPREMRKGFDVALCRALKTDGKTLFNDYVNVTPESAPIVQVTPAQVNEVSLREEIAAAADRLTGPSLQVLTATTRALLSVAAA